jgi:murein DD-endopeptidase MepM/ murein hydrolase activator NlpD
MGFFAALGKPLKILAGWFFTPFKYLLKFTLHYPLFWLYQGLRRMKKMIIGILSFKGGGRRFFGLYSPFLLITLTGLLIVFANISAKDVKPENFGKNNILFKITAGSGNYWEDEILSEEVKEGPLNQQTAPTSYLENEALSAEDNSMIKEKNEGIDTLISTTQDESALISPEITDPEAVIKQRDKIIDYVVQPGDVLGTIASKFGININTLIWENNLSYYSTIRPGQTLKILPINGLTHKIKKGETLKSIANTYKADVNKIIEFNKLASADDLQINEQLIVPGGVKQAVAAQPTYSVTKIFSAPAAAPSGSKLQWPTNSYRITQYYSWLHTGLDIGNPTGNPVYASEDGKIIRAGWNNSGYGYFIEIDHGNGLHTLYAHLSKIYVKVGEIISRSQVIGAIGSTGRSTGPHLHFEVRVNGSRVNPLGYIR